MFLLILIPTGVSAQVNIDELEPENYFDFWVGEWEVSWNEGEEKMGRGTNEIKKTLDGKVIQENFRILEGQNKGFKGTSISVYQSRFERWKQAWADKNGGYFDFNGKIDGNKRIFQTEVFKLDDGRQFTQRMVFYDITKNSMTWDWESSNDGGENWTLNWRIFYNRKNNIHSSERLLELSKKYYDPEGNWDTTELALHIQEPRLQTPLRYSILELDNKTGSFNLIREYEEGIIERIITADGESQIKLNESLEIPVEIKEKYRLNEESNFGYRNFYTIITGLPMSLNTDLWNEIKKPVETEFNGETVLSISIELKEPMISKNWVLYIHPEEYTIKALKFDHHEEDKTDELIIFDGLFYINKIKIPHIRHWHEFNSQEYLGSDLIVKVLD